MNEKKLKKIEKLLMEIRRNPRGVRERDLVSLAKKLEWGEAPGGKGKHPTYVRESALEAINPLSIPSHPGDMGVGTVQEIVDILLNDVDVWRSELEAQKDSAKKD